MQQAFVQVLGSNSAMPAYGRKPSSHYVVFGNHHFLIDCGEGSQFTMYDLNIKKSKISHIFITHLHGDHLFGLPGLLTSYELSNRTAPLTIYGPAPIKSYLEFNIQGVGHHMSYPLEIIEIDTDKEQCILQLPSVEVKSFPLEHRVPCVGYRIDEKPGRRNIDKSIIEQYDLTLPQIKQILDEQTIHLDTGITLTPEQCLLAPTPVVSYAYCSDTRYSERIIPVVEKSTLLYHESTYLETLKQQARERYHSTAVEAATIAAKAEVKQLLLGHFSSRYQGLSEFKEEASQVFADVVLAKEGMVIDLKEIVS